MRRVSLGCNWIVLGLLRVSTGYSSNSGSCGQPDLSDEELLLCAQAGERLSSKGVGTEAKGGLWDDSGPCVWSIRVSMKRASR